MYNRIARLLTAVGCWILAGIFLFGEFGVESDERAVYIVRILGVILALVPFSVLRE